MRIIVFTFHLLAAVAGANGGQEKVVNAPHIHQDIGLMQRTAVPKNTLKEATLFPGLPLRYDQTLDKK